jgi:hypothetical protein
MRLGILKKNDVLLEKMARWVMRSPWRLEDEKPFSEWTLRELESVVR